MNTSPGLRFLDSRQVAWEVGESNVVATLDAARDHRRRADPTREVPRIDLLAVDVQNDFCHPGGALYVGGRYGNGALHDTYNLARFVVGNVDRIDRIWATMDSHVPGQVFFTSFWTGKDGREPDPFTMVRTDDIREGRLAPSPMAIASVPAYCRELGIEPEAWVMAQLEFYLDRLERDGRHSLILWPHHCLVGTAGHAIAQPFLDAALFHSLARSCPFTPVPKGLSPWTESYSVFSNEVSEDHLGHGLRNDGGEDLCALLVRSAPPDAIVVAGQASSHCVRSSLDDLIAAGSAVDPDFPSRVYILGDCMSAVVTRDAAGRIIPALDFTEVADESMRRWSALGANVVQSVVPMEEWPGMSDLLSRAERTRGAAA